VDIFFVEIEIPFQIQISEGKWPSRVFWARLGQQLNVTFMNETIDADYGVWAELEVLRNPLNSGTNQTNIDKVRQHIFDNFLQVIIILSEYII
jgi:hypothetical protein